MANNFWEDLKRGKQGETIVKSILQSMDYEVQDVTNDPEYQKIDVDFIVGSHQTGDAMLCEVKSDWRMADTGNICLEIRHVDGKRLGWFSYTKAEILFFVDMKSRVIYLFKTSDIKEVTYKLINEKKIQSFISGNYYCYLLPLAEIKHLSQQVVF